MIKVGDYKYCNVTQSTFGNSVTISVSNEKMDERENTYNDVKIYIQDNIIKLYVATENDEYKLALLVNSFILRVY